MSFKTKLISIAVVGLVSSFNASAGLVTSFNGTYDEDTGVESAGDFDNIGGFTDVGSFALVGEVNTFLGSISTLR